MSPPQVSPPALIVFDVNETLSDMSPLAASFEAVGLAANESETWFAALLRDGFALTSVGANPDFAELAAQSLRLRLQASGDRVNLERDVDTVMNTLTTLDVHPDVVAGVRALRATGIRLVTLSNGATSVAEELLQRAGIRTEFEKLLSVADGPAWKPAAGSYARALEVCGVRSEEAMLVAVHPWDIDGAARAGLRTGWLRRSAPGYPTFFLRPEVEAVDLVALAGAVSG
ncbi:MAG: haloacid dehalogenase type II [Janthinobacterium lividum]